LSTKPRQRNPVVLLVGLMAFGNTSEAMLEKSTAPGERVPGLI
jgi:hypothetical protein